MQKTLFAAFAVVVALLGVVYSSQPRLTEREERYYGPSMHLPNAVCIIFVDTPEGVAMGNAFLVDKKHEYYLTAAHVVRDATSAFLYFPNLKKSVIVRRIAANVIADIAIFKAGVPAKIRPIELASAPPETGEMLTVLAYHRIGNDVVRPRFFGFQRPFRVVTPQTDSCISPEACEERDAIKKDVQEDPTLVPIEHLSLLYPYFIYAKFVVTSGGSSFGLIPGMSGSPVINERGHAVGISSRMEGSNSHGRSVLLSPAYIVNGRTEELLP